jgi:hypothetical protein
MNFDYFFSFPPPDFKDKIIFGQQFAFGNLFFAHLSPFSLNRRKYAIMELFV